MPATAGALFPSTGNCEDLLDIISVVDAKNTPISSSVAKVGADLNNPGLYSYQADSYNSPTTDGVVDSADVSDFDDPTKNRVLLSARAQKFRRTIKVSDFQQNVQDVAGVGKKKEMARGTARAITELKRDIEATISSDNDSVEGSGSVAYKTRGLGSWISSSAQTDLPVPASQRTPSGSIDSTATTSLTESKLQDVLQSIYQQTGTTDSLVLVAGPALKKAITNFTRFTVNSTSNVFNLRQTSQSADSSTLASHISLYEGDFSSVQILPSLLLNSTASTDAEKFARGYVVNADHLMLRYGRRPRFQELEDMGGGARGLIDAIVSLACLTPKAMGKFNATA
jgi:Family of unknown function (DUF5309)